MTTDYLHDAVVNEIVLTIDNQGNRVLRLRLTCDQDCGVDQWNGKVVDIVFLEPLLVLSELFGHLANEESLNSWEDAPSERIKSHLAPLVSAGIRPPFHTTQLVFHSGSVLEVACVKIQFTRVSLE